MFARHCWAAVFTAILAFACAREEAVPKAETRMLPDKWWVAACGDVVPLQVGHPVTPPVLLKRVDPSRTGPAAVIVATVVDVNGNVCDARIVRTFESIPDAPVLEVVKQWKFRPATLNGKPRAAVYYITVGTPASSSAE